MAFQFPSGASGRRLLSAVALAAAVTLMAAPAAWAQANGSSHGVHRIERPGLPDIVVQKMSAPRGRVYFATRTCVICHKVNRIGGSMGPPLDSVDNGGKIDVLAFVTRMWRGARAMVSLQDSLLGEAIELAPDELADIIAFLHDPAEQKKFSEKDIPDYIQDFIKAREGALRR